MAAKVELVWEAGCQLGEGPVWLPGEQTFWFVDIKAGRLHRYHPASDTRDTFAVGGKPSFIVPDDRGGLLVGSEHGVYPFVDGRLGSPLFVIDQPAHNRTNDGMMDQQGRLWFGTMDDEEQRTTGALYCYTDGQLHRMGAEAVVTNGPAVTRDGKTLYHVDSAKRTIWRFPVLGCPALGKGEVFLQLEEADGCPDGVTLDADGNLWVALWDGWGVRQYAADGRMLRHVPFPCARVTKLAFGGADLRTAFVTSARTGLSAEQLASQPLAGSLFRFAMASP